MTQHFSPRQFDAARFASQNASLTFEADGEQANLSWSSDFERLLSEACEPHGVSGLAWTAVGEQRPGVDGTPEPWLHLVARASVRMVCQRCLAPATVDVGVDRWFRFVADETTAAAQDDASEEDVLALDPKPDLLQLVEDELLMALPLVPKHPVCPEPPPMNAGDDEFEAVLAQKPSAFAALAQIKRGT